MQPKYHYPRTTVESVIRMCLYKQAPDVEATSYQRRLTSKQLHINVDVDMTLLRRQVPAGFYYLPALPTAENNLKIAVVPICIKKDRIS